MRKLIVILSAIAALASTTACSTLHVKEYAIDPVLFEAGKSTKH
jgi:hypothetical protein